MADHVLSVATLKEKFSFLHRDIVKVQALGAYSWIYSGEKKCCCCKHLNAIMKQLKPSGYLYRAHRSYIVNVDKIYQCTKNGKGYLLIMTDGSRVPVSKRESAGFMKFYNRRKKIVAEMDTLKKNQIENKISSMISTPPRKFKIFYMIPMKSSRLLNRWCRLLNGACSVWPLALRLPN